ncbi:MAG: TetR family transcriptional regulator [uncultured bacterium]|nr:MAG: TetR family transcriptional regulator [uncultured bacterium]
MARKKKNPNSNISTREYIIEAATNIFHKNGLHGARMHQIAKAANVNPALLHYYFVSKEQLYEEVLSGVFKKFIILFQMNFSKDASPAKAIEGFINNYIDLFFKQPEIPVLIVSDAISGGSHLINAADNTFKDASSHPKEVIAPFLNQAIKNGFIKNVSPMQTMISIISMCAFYFVGKPLIYHIWGKPENETNFINERKKAITELVLHGILKNEKK